MNQDQWYPTAKEPLHRPNIVVQLSRISIDSKVGYSGMESRVHIPPFGAPGFVSFRPTIAPFLITRRIKDAQSINMKLGPEKINLQSSEVVLVVLLHKNRVKSVAIVTWSDWQEMRPSKPGRRWTRTPERNQNSQNAGVVIFTKSKEF